MSFYHTILQEALDVFHTHGVEEVSKHMLIRKLNVSEATFHEFFEDKHDLLQQAISHHLANETTRHEKLSAAALNAVEEMLGLLNYGAAQLKDVSPRFFPELIKTQPEAWQLYLAHSENYTLPYVRKILERGIAEGLFLSGLDLNLVTKLILGQVNVMFDQALFPSGEYALNTLYKSVYLFLIRGICTAKGVQASEKIISMPELRSSATHPSGPAPVEIEVTEE